MLLLVRWGKGGAAAFVLGVWPASSGCDYNAVTATGVTENPFLTPSGLHFVQNGSFQPGNHVPQGTDASWRLAVTGLVNQTLDLSLTELKAEFGHLEISYLKTMQCIIDTPFLSSPTGLAGTAYWTGIPLHAVLEAAGIQASAKRVFIEALDQENYGKAQPTRFHNNLTLEEALFVGSTDTPPAILAYGMNGDPIPAVNGAPLRLIVPHLYGYKNVKWISRLDVTDRDDAYGSYQEELGYSDAGLALPVAKTFTAAQVPVSRQGAVQIKWHFI